MQYATMVLYMPVLRLVVLHAAAITMLALWIVALLLHAYARLSFCSASLVLTAQTAHSALSRQLCIYDGVAYSRH
jgi:hypothetical protein